MDPSGEYRRSVARRPDIPYSEQGRYLVADHGGGSSFDGISFSERAHQMDVLNRADHLENEERQILRIVMDDPDVQSLHRRIEDAADRGLI